MIDINEQNYSTETLKLFKTLLPLGYKLKANDREIYNCTKNYRIPFTNYTEDNSGQGVFTGMSNLFAIYPSTDEHYCWNFSLTYSSRAGAKLFFEIRKTILERLGRIVGVKVAENNVTLNLSSESSDIKKLESIIRGIKEVEKILDQNSKDFKDMITRVTDVEKKELEKQKSLEREAWKKMFNSYGFSTLNGRNWTSKVFEVTIGELNFQITRAFIHDSSRSLFRDLHLVIEARYSGTKNKKQAGHLPGLLPYYEKISLIFKDLFQRPFSGNVVVQEHIASYVLDIRNEPTKLENVLRVAGNLETLFKRELLRRKIRKGGAEL